MRPAVVVMISLIRPPNSLIVATRRHLSYVPGPDARVHCPKTCASRSVQYALEEVINVASNAPVEEILCSVADFERGATETALQIVSVWFVRS
jgi:hypothetical protein